MPVPLATTSPSESAPSTLGSAYASDLPLRVALVSRSPIVRAGLVHLIAQLQEHAVVTEAVSLDGDLRSHDVVVYDLGAIDGQDTEALRDLRGLVRARTRVVGLVYDWVRRPPAAAVATGVPLVTLAVTPQQLFDVLHRAARHDQSREPAGDRRLPADLSAQEFRVMELIGAGMSNEAIAEELYVSANTVKTYIRTAYRKVGVTDRSSAILWAMRHGLAGGPDRR